MPRTLSAAGAAIGLDIDLDLPARGSGRQRLPIAVTVHLLHTGTAAKLPLPCLSKQVAFQDADAAQFAFPYLQDEVARLLRFGRLAGSIEAEEVAFHARRALRNRVDALVSSRQGSVDAREDNQQALPLDCFVALRCVESNASREGAAGEWRQENGANNSGAADHDYEDFLPKLDVEVLFAHLPGELALENSMMPANLEQLTRDNVCIVVEVCIRMMLQHLAGGSDSQGGGGHRRRSLVCKTRQRRLLQRHVASALAQGAGPAGKVLKEATLSTLGWLIPGSCSSCLCARVRARKRRDMRL